ncbi:MAG: hypothetical protein LBV21_03680, partial [Candidatus Adiutrix sp.]|nr:hypothetical protein [Candidatus Adiutrix sp.]
MDSRSFLILAIILVGLVAWPYISAKETVPDRSAAAPAASSAPEPPAAGAGPAAVTTQVTVDTPKY